MAASRWQDLRLDTNASDPNEHNGGQKEDAPTDLRLSAFAKLSVQPGPEIQEVVSDVVDYAHASATGGDNSSQNGSATSSLSNSISELATQQAADSGRRKSITFAQNAKLEDGSRHNIDHSLPRSESWIGPENPYHSAPMTIAQHIHGRKPQYHRVHSESQMAHFDRRTGTPVEEKKKRGYGHGYKKPEKPAQYRQGEMRHPFLQNTVDELARESQENLFSVGDESLRNDFAVGSLPRQEQRPSPPDQGTLGLRLVTSPTSFSPETPNDSPIPSRQSSTSRSRTYRSAFSASVGTTRDPSRRRSSRATSSMSPAHSFLSQFSPRSTRSDSQPPPSPDAEGQEIGESKYIIGKKIGYGGFSVIKEVFTLDEDGRRVRKAVKIVRKQVQSVDDGENDRVQMALDHEVQIWKFLRHTFVLPLIEVHESDFATFCITQLNDGGTLFDAVRSRRSLPRDEWGLPVALAKRYAWQLACAIRYLHQDMGIVHRDVKLENCLLDMSGADAAKQGGNLLLCDFGLADFLHADSRHSPEPFEHQSERKFGPSATSTNIMGSIGYVAPEVIDTAMPIYHTGVDIWAFGVVLFALLTGDLPFKHEFQPRLLLMITKGEWDWNALRKCQALASGDDGDAVHDLVKGCLTVDMDRRWDIADVLASPWFAGFSEEQDD